MFDRIGQEIDLLLGGREQPHSPEATRTEPAPPPTPADKREELDRRLRAELEAQGVTVTGREVARVVSAAVGKSIEWAG